MITGNFAIDHLPPTVRTLDIENCSQRYKLQTRTLPRELYAFKISHNQIYGTVDLQSLPPSIVYVTLSNNKIKGPLKLIHLPETLVRLELECCSIRQETVHFGPLPKSLQVIALGRNKIKSTIPLLEGMDNETSIFIGGDFVPRSAKYYF